MTEDQFDNQFAEIYEKTDYPPREYKLCTHCNTNPVFRSDGFCTIKCALLEQNRRIEKSLHRRLEEKTISGKQPDRYDTPCQVWTGALSGRKGNQYPVIRLWGKAHNAAHVAWILHNEDQPINGQRVIHGCRNKLCINPEHLFLGTQRDAIRNGRNLQ